MSRSRLLVLANAGGIRAIDAALGQSRGRRFAVERVSRCSDALRCLAASNGDPFSAIVADLFLADSRGLETLETLLRTAPGLPILIVTRRCDESVAQRALLAGAQDYLLLSQLDGNSLPKALDDMLARSAHAEAVRRAGELAQVTLESIGDAVVTTDLDGTITYLNPVAQRMTGWPASEACGKPLQDVVRIIDAETREPPRDPLQMAMREDIATGLSENCLLVRRDGQETAIEDTATPIHDRHGRVTGAVIVFHDVSAALAMSRRMTLLAQHDVLTGLPNRLLLNDRVARAIEAARRRGSSLAVLFMDVDLFKSVNDTMGHAAGDQLLQSVARRLEASVRRSDTVSRWGGDEFVVLLSEVSCPEDAAFSADKLRASIAASHRVDDQDVHVTASVGIAVYPADGGDAEALISRADAALLRAKAHQRGSPPLKMFVAAPPHVPSKASKAKPAPEDSPFSGYPSASV